MKRKLCWHANAWEDYLYWQKNDKAVLKKINELIQAIYKGPFEGIGKPEPLKYSLSGLWSRRISLEDRLVYAVDEQTITILACRYHYSVA